MADTDEMTAEEVVETGFEETEVVRKTVRKNISYKIQEVSNQSIIIIFGRISHLYILINFAHTSDEIKWILLREREKEKYFLHANEADKFIDVKLLPIS